MDKATNFTTHDSRLMPDYSQFTTHHSQFTTHNSQLTIHNSQLTHLKAER
jgi:hypothetical protein